VVREGVARQQAGEALQGVRWRMQRGVRGVGGRRAGGNAGCQSGGVKAGQELGYRRLLLDTLPAMRIAMKLYRELGFSEAPAYYPSPVEGTIFLTLDLSQWSEDAVNNENLFHLCDYNQAWSRQMQQLDPGFFEKLSHLQSPA